MQVREILKRPGRFLLLLALFSARLQADDPDSPGALKLTEGRLAPRVAISGALKVLTSELPAVWMYDYEQGRILIDIQVNDDLHTWALLDWGTPSPMGFIGKEDACFWFRIEQTEMPRPEQLEHLLRVPVYEGVRFSDIPAGMTSLREGAQGETLLAIKEANMALAFRAMSASRMDHPLSFDKDISRCQPLSDLEEALQGSTTRGAHVEETAMSSYSVLEYNHSYTFRGWYGYLGYQGKVVSQTPGDYNVSLATCTSDGPNECKPYWESGGFFGRYGYHCGDGWGSGTDKYVSGLDYCCQLHDRNVWGKNTAENLCGFAACLTCRFHAGLLDWEEDYTGDFWAQKVIDPLVLAGVTALACYPQSKLSYLGGFTCD